MSATAIVTMIVAMLVIWGGLAAAIVNLVRSSPTSPPPAEPVEVDPVTPRH